MGFVAVSVAPAGISTASGNPMSATFSGGNGSQNLLVVVVQQQYNGSGTQPIKPTISDTAGNEYLTALGPIGVVDQSGEGMQATVFYVVQTIGVSSNTITATNDENAQENSTIMAVEYAGSIPATQPDFNLTTTYVVEGIDEGLETSSAVPTGELLIAFGTAQQSDVGANVLNESNGMTGRYENQFYGWQDIIGSGSSQQVFFNITKNFIGIGYVAFKNSQPLPLGGSAGGYSGMQLLGGPKYSFDCLPEGKKIACAVIDCTILQQVNGTFNFPELNDISGVQNLQGYVTVSFDLANFLTGPGAGLSECWSVIAYCKPMYGIANGGAAQDDFQVPPSVAVPALLSNTSNGQTVVLGGGAVASGKTAAVESIVFPFPYYGSSMPVRFFAPFLTPGLPLGKYTLLFCNFDVGSAGSLVGFYEPTT